MRSPRRRATPAICRTIRWRSPASRFARTDDRFTLGRRPARVIRGQDRYVAATNVKEFTSRSASELLDFGEAASSMATALLVSQAAPEPRSWVGRVRVV